MNDTKHTESPLPSLILFVTGEAPRSIRARENLKSALQKMELPDIHPKEVDLFKEPEKTLAYSVFATPALIRTTDDGDCWILYGDLSEEDKLLSFLTGIQSQG